jgi:hypothetical protein
MSVYGVFGGSGALGTAACSAVTWYIFHGDNGKQGVCNNFSLVNKYF